MAERGENEESVENENSELSETEGESTSGETTEENEEANAAEEPVVEDEEQSESSDESSDEETETNEEIAQGEEPSEVDEGAAENEEPKIEDNEEPLEKKPKKHSTVFENSVRKYPVYDEEKLASIKYENEDTFEGGSAEETENAETSGEVENVEGGSDNSPEPYYNTKPSILPQSSGIDEEAKKPEPVTTPLGRIKYSFVGKESIFEFIRNHLPKEFYPTARVAPLIGGVFIAVILIGLVIFGYTQMGSMFSSNPDVNMVIKVGYPWSFLVFDPEEPDALPLKIPAFLIDLLIYVIIAYAIDVGINYAYSRAMSLTTEERKKRPKIYKVQKKNTLAEKLTETLFDD